MNLHEELTKRNIAFVRKDKSKLMKVINFFLYYSFINRHFMDRFWTVIGSKTIYYPTNIEVVDVDNNLSIYAPILEHELIHIQQKEKWGILWQISYIFLPLPILFAWFRWRWEREAYLININKYNWNIEFIADTLWSNYGWTWPKSWMTKWFKENSDG